MDAIRAMAAEHGLAALEGLADWSAHHAMMPGHKVATACCLEHMEEALLSDSAADRQTILAALALRLH
jgi:NADH:ubiquinone oxidoreductase subunit B-like Fe-S oxidoreductase